MKINVKEIANKIWKFVNSKFFVYVLVCGLLISLAGQCQSKNNYKRKDLKKDQNISALHDSLSLQKQKSGDLQASIDGFIASEKELKHLNRDLYDEVKKQQGKVVSLNKIVFKLKQDKEILKKYVDDTKTKYDSVIINKDSTYTIPWTLAYTYDENNYDIFKGETKIDVEDTTIYHIRTGLYERETNISLTWGQKEENGKLRIFVETKYPGFSPQSLSGVLIDPNTNPLMRDLYKKRHWFTGFGIGPTFNIGYDMINQKTGIFIGVGIYYNLYNF